MNRTVTLTDTSGAPLGEADLLEAHTNGGKLHLAFSVYVFNTDRTKFLLQKRSQKKMLWPGIWANTCCSHPFPNEKPIEAGMRRLNEELGITCVLSVGPAFTYRAEDPSGKGVEHEYVTTLIGTMDESSPVTPNPDEVAEWKWISVKELQKEMAAHPDLFAPWFHLGLGKIVK